MPFMGGSQQQPGGQQFGQPQLGSYQPYGQPQQPYGAGQSQFGQQLFGGQGFGQQLGSQPQFGGQQYGGQLELPQIVTELALRCAASAVMAVVEQLRGDQQALMGIQSQGQLAPHLYSNVLVECARRIAPVLHQALAPIAQGQMSQGSQGGQGGQQGQSFGMPQMQQMPQAWGQGAFGQGGGGSPMTGAGI